jgi:hypothetical protein
MMDSNSLTVQKEKEHNQRVAVVTGSPSGQRNKGIGR